MLRLPILAALLSLFLVSCAETPLDQAVYDDFKLFFLAPETWDEEMEDTRADRLTERLTFLRQVLIKVEEEHHLYASRCNGLTDGDSSNCQSADDLSRVVSAMSEMEMALRDGKTIRGTLGERLNFGLSAERVEKRTRIAKRVKKHFLPEPAK